MPPLVYVDRSTVREGALARLEEAIADLAAFVEENEAQLVAYSVYFNEDRTEMTVVHVHADESSLDLHLEVAGPRFARFGDLVELSSILVFGRPSDRALERLRAKARLLGSGDVEIRSPHAGFVRRPEAASRS